MKWLKQIFKKECRHLFFPEGHPPIGQRCSLCGHFNSLADLGIKPLPFRRPDLVDNPMFDMWVEVHGLESARKAFGLYEEDPHT